MIEQILINIGINTPIFLLVVLGIILRITNVLDDSFVRKSSQFVFKVSLPALIFEKLSVTDFSEVFDFSIIYYSFIITTAQFALAWFAAAKVTHAPEDKGVFVQGAFRSNFAIVGLAVLGSAVGDTAVSKASIVLAFIMPVYNFLSVSALLIPHQNGMKIDYLKFLKELATNPLILTVLVVLPFSYKFVSTPDVVKPFIHYLGAIALPLALIDIGVTVNIKNLVTASVLAFQASFLKILIFPMIMTIISVYVGFRADEIAILFVLFGSPTAIASFPMAEAMKGNIKLAGNIVVISTLFSVITLSIGFGLLAYYNLI